MKTIDQIKMLNTPTTEIVIIKTLRLGVLYSHIHFLFFMSLIIDNIINSKML